MKNRRRWDIFCAVVDNFGDIGTCWRLAQQLAKEHEADVRLWVDDIDCFRRFCPSTSTGATYQQTGSIDVRPWPLDFLMVDVADVVIEAFACELPASYVAAMAQRTEAPVWINLEYLSAEDWVEDCHLLASPHPRLPLTKYFFFPGFTSRTGGLLKERGLAGDRAAFDSAAAAEVWGCLRGSAVAGGSGLNEVGDSVSDGAFADGTVADDEIRISLFCYDNSAFLELLQSCADGTTAVRVFAAPGAATEQISRWFGREVAPGTALRRESLTVQTIPFLTQSGYDRLLWACDVNFVRGEDSFVRAQWAERPFVWQIYPQAENAHLTKLDAFLTRYLGKFENSDVVRRCWQAWNGGGEMAAAWREFVAIRKQIEQHGKVWACQLDRAGNLANNLVCFVRQK